MISPSEPDRELGSFFQSKSSDVVPIRNQLQIEKDREISTRVIIKKRSPPEKTFL